MGLYISIDAHSVGRHNSNPHTQGFPYKLLQEEGATLKQEIWGRSRCRMISEKYAASSRLPVWWRNIQDCCHQWQLHYFCFVGFLLKRTSTEEVYRQPLFMKILVPWLSFVSTGFKIIFGICAQSPHPHPLGNTVVCFFLVSHVTCWALFLLSPRMAVGWSWMMQRAVLM